LGRFVSLSGQLPNHKKRQCTSNPTSGDIWTRFLPSAEMLYIGFPCMGSTKAKSGTKMLDIEVMNQFILHHITTIFQPH
jgi:hypothetical protein